MSETDRDAVSRVLRGDREAFSHLVRAYQGRLFGLVMMMARDRAAAEEITQDAFVRAYTRIRMYDSARPFYPWIAAIAVRLALTWLRRNQRLERREGAALETAPEPGTPAIGASRLADAERNRRLWDEVQSLSSGERTVVLLYYRDELPVADIAEALGFTPGTVKTLLFRARKHLREKLGRNDDIDG